MASATKIEKDTTKFVTVKVESKEIVGVQLTLTLEEAQVLRYVFARIGGDPATTRRGLTDHISDALNEAGITNRLADSSDVDEYIFFNPINKK